MNQTTANAAALALVGTLALQLTACGTAQQSAPGQASTQPEPVTLTMSWWGDDARTETYQQAIQAFEAKLQYITVETIYGTTADEDQTADVMQVDWTWPGQNADQFVDLNEYSDVIDLEQFSQSALAAKAPAALLLSVGRPRTLSLTYGDWGIAYLYCGKVSPRRGRYKLDNLYQPFPCRKIAPKIIRPTRDRKTGIRYNRGNRKSTLQATARKGTR